MVTALTFFLAPVGRRCARGDVAGPGDEPAPREVRAAGEGAVRAGAGGARRVLTDPFPLGARGRGRPRVGAARSTPHLPSGPAPPGAPPASPGTAGPPAV